MSALGGSSTARSSALKPPDSALAFFQGIRALLFMTGSARLR
jgi:hypothetical protein